MSSEHYTSSPSFDEDTAIPNFTDENDPIYNIPSWFADIPNNNNNNSLPVSQEPVPLSPQNDTTLPKYMWMQW